jgi:hypothetical protein
MGSESETEAGSVEQMSTGAADEPSLTLEPGEAEIEEWVARERARRQAWLNGPSTEERAAFVREERERRLAALEGRPPRAWVGQRYARETQLAAEGAATLMTRWWRRTIAELVRAGREWEDDMAQPRARRRIRLDDDAS